MVDTVPMKQMLMIMAVFMSPLLGNEYWVQVLSLERMPKMDSAFEKRLKSTGYPYRIHQEHGAQKVQVGGFTTYGEAKKALWSLRCKVAMDAFIVHEGVTPVPVQVEQVPKHLAVVQKAHVKPMTLQAVAQPETQQCDPAPKATSCECICDPRALRKAEMVNALEYYKRSRHYQFGGSGSPLSF